MLSLECGDLSPLWRNKVPSKAATSRRTPKPNNARRGTHAAANGQTPAPGIRPALALEAGVEHGPQGDAVRPAPQITPQTRPGLPAVSLRVGHQQLQPALPGVLGRCGR